MPHAYNNPNLSPREFLLAVARDPKVRLKHRINAAKFLAQHYGDVLAKVTIHIGGFPEYIDTWMCTDVSDCINRTTPCPWSDILRAAQGVNFRPCKDQLHQDQIEKNKRLN
jgi:hypothetical protein